MGGSKKEKNKSKKKKEQMNIRDYLDLSLSS